MKDKISVKNWRKFQHYKNRNPPWIKLATSTFQDYEFSCLQDASKLLAFCIWTLAARFEDGELPADLDYIKAQTGVTIPTLENLHDLENNGFIVIASNLLAGCKQNRPSERETETELEGESSYRTHTYIKPSDLLQSPADAAKSAASPEGSQKNCH